MNNVISLPEIDYKKIEDNQMERINALVNDMEKQINQLKELSSLIN